MQERTNTDLIPQQTDEERRLELSLRPRNLTEFVGQNAIKQKLLPLMEDYRAADKETFDEGLSIKNRYVIFHCNC